MRTPTASRRYGPGRRGGFTLLELLVVIGLVSVTATFAIVRTTAITTGWRITRAAQMMADDLQQAYAIVGRNRTPVRIRFDASTMTLTLADRAGAVFRTRSFGPGSEFRLVPGQVQMTPAVLDVYPPGLAGDSLSIRITTPTTRRRVRMLRAGLVRVCQSDVTARCD